MLQQLLQPLWAEHICVLQIVFQINPENQAQPRAQMFSRDNEGKEVPVEKVEVAKKPFQFLWVSILREYLAFEFKPEGHLPFQWDQERVYDDFGKPATMASQTYLCCRLVSVRPSAETGTRVHGAG